MIGKFIQASVLATALALGGTAVAQSGSGSSNVQQQQGASNAQGSQNVQGQQGMNASVKSVHLAALDKTQLRDVQTQLKDLGFYKGNVDGVLGGQTRAALVSYFQNQLSLAGQGRISDNALSGFGFNKSDIEKVRGIDQSNGNQRQPTRGQETIPQQNKGSSGDMQQQQQTVPQNQNKDQTKDQNPGQSTP